MKIKEACAKYDAPLPEYNINKLGIMVLCKACDKYLELLHGELHPVQSEQDASFVVCDLSMQERTTIKFVEEGECYE